jgi:hypothetical protein
MNVRDTFNNVGNIFTEPLLSSPLHRLVSKHLMLIKFTGRKSAKAYATPVQYFCESDGAYVFFTQKSRQWWKNLQGREFVTRIAGRDYKSTADILFGHKQLVDTMKRLYPGMSADRIEQLAAKSVMVRVHPVTEDASAR